MGRTVKIKLSLKDKDGKKIIEHEFANDDLEEEFRTQDRKEFLKIVSPLQKKAKANKHKKDDGIPLNVGDVVNADDYAGEPDDLHPSIHLRFNGEDEIVWFTEEDEAIAFVINVGLDPELVRLDANLHKKKKIRRDDLFADEENPNYNPFDKTFPAICTSEKEVHSGPLKVIDEIRKQQFYKYEVSVLGTSIILDPHIEGHDEPFP